MEHSADYIDEESVENTTSHTDRMMMLEHTVMELGVELYGMRDKVQGARKSSDHVLDILRSLKTLLDDKGLIDQEDFEAAIELGKALNDTEGDLANSQLIAALPDKKEGH